MGSQNLERIELYDCQLITRAGIRRLKVCVRVWVWRHLPAQGGLGGVWVGRHLPALGGLGDVWVGKGMASILFLVKLLKGQGNYFPCDITIVS